MIKFLDLNRVNKKYEEEFKRLFNEFLNSGYYILGESVSDFEDEFANYCGVKYCIGVGNGLDALTLIFRAYIELGLLKEGDEVLVPANTYIASVLAITENRLIPVFVEPNYETYVIDIEGVKSKISNKTKAVLGVHLYGFVVEFDEIRELFHDDVLFIEDAAQAHGAKGRNGSLAGSLGNAAGFSFYPTKNLGALGDAGAVTTDSKELYDVIIKLRNYGSGKKYLNEYKGVNSRLDELQAKFLSIKLKDLDNQNKIRRQIANKYLSEITNERIILPFRNFSENHVFHQFVIRTKDRDKLKAYLEINGVQTDIHYPVAITDQNCYKEYSITELPLTKKLHSEILSLPISPILTLSEIDYIIKILNAYEA